MLMPHKARLGLTWWRVVLRPFEDGDRGQCFPYEQGLLLYREGLEQRNKHVFCFMYACVSRFMCRADDQTTVTCHAKTQARVIFRVCVCQTDKQTSISFLGKAECDTHKQTARLRLHLRSTHARKPDILCYLAARMLLSCYCGSSQPRPRHVLGAAVRTPRVWLPFSALY